MSSAVAVSNKPLGWVDDFALILQPVSRFAQPHIKELCMLSPDEDERAAEHVIGGQYLEMLSPTLAQVYNHLISTYYGSFQEFLSCGEPTPNLTSKQIYNAIRDSVIENFGDAGWGASAGSLTVKYFSPTTQICIIRVARDHHTTVWGGLTLLRALGGVRIIPHVIHLSGTLKKAQLATITHNRTVIARRRANAAAHMSDAYDVYIAKSTKEIEALKD